MGTERRLNGTSKANRLTDGRTHGQTFQLIERIGPEGRFVDKASLIEMFYGGINLYFFKFPYSDLLGVGVFQNSGGIASLD